MLCYHTTTTTIITIIISHHTSIAQQLLQPCTIHYDATLRSSLYRLLIAGWLCCCCSGGATFDPLSILTPKKKKIPSSCLLFHCFFVLLVPLHLRRRDCTRFPLSIYRGLRGPWIGSLTTAAAAGQFWMESKGCYTFSHDLKKPEWTTRQYTVS